MIESSAPVAAPHMPRNIRLSFRLTSSHLEWWKFIANFTEQSLSDMIRKAIDEYIEAAEQAPPSVDRSESPFSGMIDVLAMQHGIEMPSGGGVPVRRKKRWNHETPCDKAIVMRVSVAEMMRWTEVAERENSTLSFMIREAGTVYVNSYIDAMSRLRKEKEEQEG